VSLLSPKILISQARNILKTVLKSDNNFEIKYQKIFYFEEIFFSQKLTFCTPDQPRSYNFPTFRFLKSELVKVLIFLARIIIKIVLESQ
jgi:hypothetical protein